MLHCVPWDSLVSHLLALLWVIPDGLIVYTRDKKESGRSLVLTFSLLHRESQISCLKLFPLVSRLLDLIRLDLNYWASSEPNFFRARVGLLKGQSPMECKLPPSLQTWGNASESTKEKAQRSWGVRLWTPLPYSECHSSLFRGAVDRVAPTRIKHIVYKWGEHAPFWFLLISYISNLPSGWRSSSWLSTYRDGYFKIYNLNKESQIFTS